MEDRIVGYMMYVRNRGFLEKLVIRENTLVFSCTTIEKATMFASQSDFASSCANTEHMLHMSTEQDIYIVPVPVTELMVDSFSLPCNKLPL